MSKCGKGKKALANKSKYEAYGKWAKHRYEYIWDKLHEYTEKLKHLLTVQLGIVGGFIVYRANSEAISDTLVQTKLLLLGIVYFLISIFCSIIGLWKKDPVSINRPTPLDGYEEDAEADKHVWSAITKLADELLRHNNDKSKIYSLSLLLFSLGLLLSILYFAATFSF